MIECSNSIKRQYVAAENFAKYSSLFTLPSQTPINRAFGEVKSSRNSSPLGNALFIKDSEEWVKSEEFFMNPLSIGISET